MNRIESEDTIIVDGKRMFSDGDPYSEDNDSKGTQINAQFLNGVQEELCSFIESQKIELDHKKQNQLALAISSLVTKSVAELMKNYIYDIDSIGRMGDSEEWKKNRRGTYEERE